MKKLMLLIFLLPIGVHAQNQARMISGTNVISTCPYTITKQDVTKLDVFTTSTACAVTLPAATTNGFGKGSIFSVKNNGTGSVTITIGGGESIDGNPSVTLLPGAGMDIYSTGTGYSSQPGAGGGGGGGGGGINPPAGDIGGNAVVPLVISTHLNSPLPILQGGTGTQTPGSVAGTNITITGSWPNEHFSALSACWQNNGSILTCEPFTNAVPPVTATVNSGNSTIDISVAPCAAGGSHTAGIVPDPGVSPDLTKFFRSDCTLAVPTASVTAVPNPLTSANLSNTAAPWNINVDVANQGPNPSVDVRAYGVRAVNPFSTPAATGLTANISSSSTSATISSASTFQNGDGVVIYGAGATNVLSTPGTFTVTPSVASSSTGTGFVKTAPAGALTKCYKIAARDIGGGITAASSEVCTTTGNTLGSNSVTISTLSRSNNTVTVTTSSAHGLVTGAMVYIKGTSVESQFGGWYTVAGSADNTHFTLSTGNDTRTATGASTATGGTAYWFNSNHLALPAPGTGVYEYIIYAGASGAETLLGATYPAVSGISADPTYMVYDDFGSPMMDGITLPAFIPTSAPGSATNDSLVTTIASGAGTTSLTLANSASNTVSGATIRFDNAPNIVAAFNAAKNVTGGMVYFPATAIGGNPNYVTNSFLDLSSFPITGVSQAGNIFLGDTMHLPTGIQWHGDVTPTQLTYPSFAITAGMDLNIGSAYPGIWTSGGNYSGINIHASPNNAYLGFFLTLGNIPTATFTNMNFYGGSSTDYMGVPFYAFTQFSAGGTAGLKFTNCLFSTGPSQVDGSTATPLFITKNYGEITFDGLFLNRRGIFIDPNQSGQTAEINMGFEEQGGIMPMFTLTPGAGGFPTGWLHIRNTILDTMDQPLFASLQSVFGGKILIDGTTFPLGAFGNVPLISGLGLSDTELTGGAGANITLTGQNTNISLDQEGNLLDGTYGTTPTGQALRQFNEHVAVGAGYSLFTSSSAPAAPTCSVATAGPPFSLAGTFSFQYGVAYPPNNGVGPLSAFSGNCTADGSTQQITITIPSAVAGALGYTIWRNGASMLTCSSPSTTTTSFLWTGSACGPTTPSLAGGGPAGIKNSSVWGNTATIGQYIDFAGLGSAPSNPATGYCRTYYDSVAGTTKGINSSGGSCSPTGGGGGSGTVVPALQNSVTFYDQAGTVAHVAGIAGPTGPNSVPSFWVTIPSGSAATAPQPILAGIPGRTVSGASDTILVTDRVSTVTYTNAGATAVSLPGAGTTGFGSNFCFKMKVQGSSAVATITPAAGTINGGATQTVLQGQQALVCSFDNSNYIATIADPPAAAGSNIALARGDSSLSFSSSAGGGTVTHTAGALTANQIVKGNGSADITIGDLTGDCTTSGTMATTCTGFGGTTVTGTNGNLVGFGASNTLVDSTIVGANVITSTGTLLAGNVVSGTAAKNVGPTSIATNTLVTAASNAGFANQLCASASTNKACAFTSFIDMSSTGYAGTSTGAVNVLAACPTNTATALATGMVVSFLPNLANTTTNPTFNLCTLGAKTITKNGTAVLAANDMITTAIANLRYDGTGWQLQNPQTSAGGGSSALSSLTAAISSNSISNGNNPQTWQFSQSTNNQNAVTISESAPSTAGTVSSNLANQAQLEITTASASTATPLSILQGPVTSSSAAFPAAQIATTWNGSAVMQGLVFSVTDTAHGASSKLFNLFGGSGGTTSLFSVDTSGGTSQSSVFRMVGTPVTGTGTTAIPMAYLNDTGNTAPTTFNTNGTELGANAKSTFTGNMLDFHVNGGTSVAKLDYQGNLTVASCIGCGISQLTGYGRWNKQAWSHQNGGIRNDGDITAAASTCTTPGDNAATAALPSYLSCPTGATANTTQFEYAGSALDDFCFGSGATVNNCDFIAYGAPISATTASRAWIGIWDAGAAFLGLSDCPAAHGSSFRYSSVAGDTNYMAVNDNNGTCTATSTGITAAANTWHHFEVRTNDVAGSVTFLIDGVVTNTISTNYPTTAVGGIGEFLLDNTTTTSETMLWAYSYISTLN